MLRFTLTVERRKSRPQPAARGIRRVHPLLALGAIYCAVLITSLITGDASLLSEFTRGLVQLASRLLGFDMPHTL